MRDLVVFLFVMAMMPTAFRRPYIGMLLFSWLAYMRPQDLCWGFARTMRLSFFVSIAMLAGWWANEQGKRRFTHWEPRTRLMVLLMVLIAISYVQAKVQDAYTNRYFFEYCKIIVIALFTVGQCDTRERLRGVFWMIALSLGFYGVKNGLIGVLKGGAGQILRGPGGMLEDNNDFALALVMNVPLLYYLGIGEKKAWVRKATLAAVCLTILTVLLTHSRGAFLSLCFTALWIAWRSGKLFRAVSVLFLLAALFPVVAPDHVLERLASIGDTGESSASARLTAWATAFEMIKDNPIWGVGMRNFQPSYPTYSVVPLGEGAKTYVAHNSYFQIWAESGTLAFFVYMVVLASVFVTLGWIYRKCRYRPDLEWASNYARMMEATTVGFSIGAFFLNRGHFDLFYHWLALVAALNLCVRAALRRAPDAAAVAARGSGPSGVQVRVAGLGGGSAASPVTEAGVGWRSSPGWR
ncbi:MAG: putative O-glycosylation ligase, exosortase A system-associated [Planctomycetota bacterium]|nr:putative O-glycosylation ligase, exosortase A system-associated [Planctomycetota bacterium]